MVLKPCVIITVEKHEVCEPVEKKLIANDSAMGLNTLTGRKSTIISVVSFFQPLIIDNYTDIHKLLIHSTN